MNWNDIPEAFINKENFMRLLKEAYEYRRSRNIAATFAVTGWIVVAFMLFNK